MFKNYLKIALRNLRKYKSYSFINITGLAVGMACSMLILMWVQHEMSYDRFNENAGDIYRVVENQYYAGGEVFPVAVTPSPLAPALKEQFPEVMGMQTPVGKRLSAGPNDFTISGNLCPEICNSSPSRRFWQHLFVISPGFIALQASNLS